MRIVMSLVACGCLLAACVSEQDMTAVENAVAEFHTRQEAGDDAAIYAATSQQFKTAAALDDLTRLNVAVRMADGCSEPARDKMNVSSRISTEGSFVTVSYTRTCARGPIVEQFHMRMSDGHAELEGYNVSGEAILASPGT